MKQKLRAGILGATGAVGQKFIELLANHPWIEITAVAASQRSAGKKYGDVANWFSATPIPLSIANLEVQDCIPNLDCDFVFSGLDASVAGEIETSFAQAGYPVISNSRNHRFSPNVPLLVPDVNPDHLALIEEQKFGKGFIVTNPNCSTTGLVIALKPLQDQWGLEQVNVVTMQALSGAGYPGVASLDILDNVIPYIGSEEQKMESETVKILGKIENKAFKNASIKISAQCNRVAVMNGHLECVNIKLKTKAKLNEIIQVWQNYQAEPQQLKLPSAPNPLIYCFTNEKYPQPRLHRDLGNGMAVSIGRLRECPLFDYKFVVLSHNTVRGAAGGAILNTEILIAKGILKI